MADFKFFATVYKVQTLVDNGIRVTLDLSEQEIETMAKLAVCQRDGIVCDFSVSVEKQKANYGGRLK